MFLRSRIKKQLLDSGFKNATFKPSKNRYYKEISKNILFVIIINKIKNNLEIIYGCKYLNMSDQNNIIRLNEYGIDCDQIKVRSKILLNKIENIKEVYNVIYNEYHQALNYNREMLDELRKEKFKNFTNKIDDELKKLGFVKKGNNWLKKIKDNIIFKFELQKSIYSDIYYLNLYLINEESKYYYDKRLVLKNGKCNLNWQLLSDEESNELLFDLIIPEIKAILDSSIDRLIKL